jgi:hypothetical protein
MKLMLLFLSLLMITSMALAAEYPTAPIEEVTPGDLCDRPDAFRYPENIPYCSRDVDFHTREEVFQTYRRRGFRLTIQNRQDYKIDHLIPLCAGGSNAEENLWPQHVSLFTVTDPIERVGCLKLRDGKIRQRQLIRLIKKAKFNISEARAVLRELESL